MPKNIFNTDQCGINYELVSGRTLDISGTKQVIRSVGSTAGTTHSYTIQPTISADGHLLSPMIVCLQEPSGSFGENVARGLHKAPNLYVVASKSGKMTKELILEWFRNVYFPIAPLSSILFVDSWTGFNDRNAIEKQNKTDKEFRLLQIPPKTTGLIQPLDVGFFRTWKQFIRNINDHILLEEDDIDIQVGRTAII